MNVTFPDNYASEQLAGKAAAFAVTAKSVESPGTVTIDDAFATSLGLESLDKLREAVKARIAQEHAGASRQKLKRALLDQLDALHKFEAPPTLVEEEFKNVWNTVLSDLKSQNRTFEDEGTTEEKASDEYRGIADRRVRLGLVLAEIGEKNNIKVTDEEMSRALVERVRQYPGPGEGSVGLLPEESQCARQRQGADLRGKGGRLPGRAGRGHGEAGDQGRALQGR